MARFFGVFLILILSLAAPVAAQRPTRGGLVAHEWGVWKIQSGRPTHLEELAAEVPPFVHTSPHVAVRPVPLPPPPILGPVPLPHPHPHLARKPVMFFYASEPTHVHVEVGFRGGEPWLYYPDAQVLASRSLVFDGWVLPRQMPILPPVQPGHFWNDLRAAGADPFVTNTGSVEQFLFYDGPVTFTPSFVVGWQGRGAMVSRASSENRLWLVEHGQFTETDLTSGNANVVAQGASVELRGRLHRELEQRGLTSAEAHSLLETWRDDLFRMPAPTALYFVPREHYDQMLPIEITPRPTELVRVGLVIEQLGSPMPPPIVRAFP